LRVGVRDDDGAVLRFFGSCGEVDGEGGFSGPALLIGDDDRFHENDNRGILVFMKE
jgi:hypothetical protein